MRAGIALGSNIGDRLGHLREAVDFLKTLATVGQPFLVSHAYETEPVDCSPGSPLFLNAAVEMDCTLAPLDLLSKLQQFEMQSGRPSRRPKNAPRPIDLDILYCDNIAMTHPSLVVPHPRIAERFFVLKPLAEICPDRVLRHQTHTIAELLEKVRAENIKTYSLAE